MGLTLARGGSKRVPRKNVIDVNGKPLIQYTIDEVKKSKYIDNYIVSTDDEDIKLVCRELEQTYFDRKWYRDPISTNFKARFELGWQVTSIYK